MDSGTRMLNRQFWLFAEREGQECRVLPGATASSSIRGGKYPHADVVRIK